MGLPGPDENNPADVPTDIDKLRQRIDVTAAMYAQGTTAARPAAGIVGRLYFSTDERLLYYDDGSVWQSPFTPPGTLRLSAAAAVTSGWLLCDGAAYPRAEYSALFGVIGTAWGAGDGTSTFNVPDLRGRAPVGGGTGTGLTARTVGGKGGEEVHLLAATESGIAEHRHHLEAATAGGVPPTTEEGTTKWVRGSQTTNAGDHGILMTTTGAFAWSLAVGYVSEGGARAAQNGHNNMQPFAVVSYLIKT